MPLDVLLISPKIRSISYEYILNKRYSIPYGLVYLGSVLEKGGYDVLVDVAGGDDVLEKIDEYKPKVVGVTSTTPTYPDARIMVNRIKEVHPEIKTVMGGHHVTFTTEKTLSECKTDYVIRGEGEVTLLALVESIIKNKPMKEAGVACRIGRKTINSKSLSPPPDIDSLPNPNIGLLQPDLRKTARGFYLLTSRGCAHNCVFCSTNRFYKNYRERKVTDVVDEIESQVERGLKYMRIIDDDFMYNPKRVEDICRELLDRGVKIRWGCTGRVNGILKNPELLNLMSESGCWFIMIGVESGVQDILNSYGKKLTVEQINKAVDILQDIDILSGCFYMIGSGDENDTEENINKSIDFASKLQYDFIVFDLLTPLPGTVLYDRLVKEDRIVTNDWSKYDFAHCVYRPIGLTSERMEELFHRVRGEVVARQSIVNKVRRLCRVLRHFDVIMAEKIM